jgi:hypothetical protein
MDGKVYVDSYIASNGLCFMIMWTISKNDFMEVGLTQNWETMALRTLTTVDLFYFIICEDMREYKSIEIAFGWGPGYIWLHTPLEVPWPDYMILEVCWDKGLWTLSFELSQFHGHGSGSCVNWPLVIRLQVLHYIIPHFLHMNLSIGHTS